MTGQMNFTSRMAALHSALWRFDRAYRLAWHVWPVSVPLLICGWIVFWTPDAGTSAAVGHAGTIERFATGGDRARL